MEQLEVVDRTSFLVQLSLNTSAVPDIPANYNVTCRSSVDGNSSSHLVTLLDITIQNVSEFIVEVQPLAPSTNYTCCLESNKMITEACSEDFLTKPSATGLPPEIAGVIGGVVGAVVTLLLMASILSIALGTVILVRKKR